MKGKFVLTPVKKKFLEQAVPFLEAGDWDSVLQLAVQMLTKNQLMDIILLVFDEIDLYVPESVLVKIRELYGRS